ncbi:MAG: MFS transporter [Proteobacteria bacterium]|nr:MFS transporter [Pseudomonadota bacterium]
MGSPIGLTSIDFTEFKNSWRVLILSIVGVAVSINAALLYGFGTLVIPLEQAFGWSRSELQVAVTFLFGGAVLSLQAVGWINLRFGMRRVVVASLVLISLGYLATTLIRGSVWSLYAAFALLPIIGMGSLAVTWTQLLNLWFVRNRGLALAIGLSGTGITAAVVPRLLAWGIERWDWRAAFVILAVLNIGLLLPLVLIWFRLPIEDAPARAADDGKPAPHVWLEGMSLREGLVSRRFWICNAALALVISAIVGMVTNTIPMLRDRGLSGGDASLIFSGFGVSLVFGRVVVGYLLDRLWPPGVAAVSLFLPALGCLIYMSGNNDLALLGLAAVLVGFGAGAEFDIAAFLIARYFGLREYGRLFGVHQGLNTVASALAPLLFAALFSHTGSYAAMLVYCLVCSLVGPALLLTLGRHPGFSGVVALAGRT